MRKRPAAIETGSSVLKKPATKDLGFFDPHFHIWDVSATTATGHDGKVLFAPDGTELYDREAYEADVSRLPRGFRFEGGVFLEAVSVCHADLSGPEYSMHCLSEAKFASRQLCGQRNAYVVVATCALEQPDAKDVLAKLSREAGVRGVRQILNYKPDWPRNGRLGELLDNPQWRLGFAVLREVNFSFDMQLNPHQFLKAASFLTEHLETRIIINHLGSPLLEDLTTHADRYWMGMEALAKLPNTFIKISMLCYTDKEWDQNPTVIEAVHRVIALFGPRRCLFASNCPVDKKDGWPPERLLNAFLALAQRYSMDDREYLFSRSARRAYRV